MKQISLPYEEYQELIKTIDLQNKTIEELKKSDHIVLIDNRHEYMSYSYANTFGVPKIVVGEDRAKEYLKDEYDKLYKTMIELNEAKKRAESKDYWFNKNKRSPLSIK